MLDVRVLGELELEADGTRLPPPASQRARALLGFLALRPGPHPRAALAARFWPDVLDESARTSLRGALADLRRALGPAAHLLEATRESVALAATTDAAAFAAHVAAGRDAEALALCRGELLAGLDDDWILVARDEHREAQGAALARLAAAARDPAQALAHLRARVALEPLSEEAHRGLMTGLAAAGDRAAALAVYGRLADRLRSELRTAPSPATRELAEALRARAAGAAPPPLPRALDPARARSPFVGRAAELGRLRAALAGRGDRHLLAISGEPGIGKTRLLAELARAAHADGAAVLYGRCPEEPVAPYGPFAEALRPLASGDPALAPLAGEPAPEDGAGARLRLFEAVAAALADAPGDPVVLALDDLHWADRPTLLLLAHVLRDDRPGPVVVVGTYRESELGRGHPLSRTLADLRRDRLIERVALAGLDEPTASALIAVWVGDRADAGLAAAVHAETGGNPFFIEEVLRHLLESDTFDVRAVGVPESVREVIGRRLDRLGEDAVEVLETAAVIGPEFDLALLEQACPAPRDAVLDALERAMEANLLRAVPDRPAAWAFPHALIREALHDELSGLRRTRLHARIAEALANAGRADPAALAHHGYESAALVGAERAAGWAEAAGRAALERLAYEEAAEHHGHALQALELEPGAHAARRARLRLALADALVRAGEPSAADACAAAVAAARELGDPELLGGAALASCGVGVTIVGLDHERVALLEEALGALGNDAHPGLRAELLARLAIALYYAPGRTRAGELSAEAVAAAREAGEPGALLAALNARHVGLWHPGGLDERFAVAEEMIALGLEHGRREAELQGRNWRCVDLWEAGDVREFEAEAHRHEALADALRLPGFRWYAGIWRAALAALRGAHDEARRLAEEAGAAGTRAGDPNGGLFRRLVRFQCLLQEGAFADDELVSFSEQAVREYVAGVAYVPSLAWMYAERGRLDEARAMLDDLARDDFAAVDWDANWLTAMADLAEVTAVLGDRERAATLYDRLLPYAGRRMVAGRAVFDEGAADYALARYATTLGRTEAAAAHFEAAIASDEAVGARAWLVRTRTRYAELLAAAGEPERAAEQAAAARAAARAIGR